MDTQEFNDAWPHTLEIAVAWGEMDALGHINNAVYFRYFESARIAYLQNVESLLPLPRAGTGPILAYIDCRFQAPLVYPDTAMIGSRITGIGNTSLKMEQVIFSTAQQIIAAQSKSVLVLIDYATGDKIRVPDTVRQLFTR